MFVTDKIIYLQMHKTACTHIASLLSKHIGGKQIGKHNWLEDYQTQKLICGSIRNPWDWYVSLWAFGCIGEGYLHTRVIFPDFLKFPVMLKSKLRSTYGPYLSKNLQFSDLSSHFKNEINKPINLWRKSYNDNENPECFRTWLKLIYDKKRFRDFNEGYSESSINIFAGLMTYRYCNFFLKDFFKTKNFKGIGTIEELEKFDRTNNILDFVIKVESLENDFIQILEKSGYNINQETKNQILQSGKTNKSKHNKTSHYYDQETINLVAEKEKFIIKKYNYKPPIK